MNEFDQYGPQSFEVLKGAGNFGLLAVYLFSRRGASGLLDFSRVKVCGFRTASWFMIGASYSMYGNLLRVKEKFGSAETITLNTRVASNIQTQALLRSMQHHLMRRQMPMQEILNR